MTQELRYATAVDLARLVRTRAVSPVELIEDFLRLADVLEPRLNTFVTLDVDGARAQAKQAEVAVLSGDELGPLHGVPMSVKDFLHVRGMPTRFGSRLSDAAPAAQDSVVVARARAAGAVIVGKTTAPDYGWKATSDSPLTGNTRNPWNPLMTAGGSSSGAAAGVAAGLGPLTIGTDGAGSIRIPAAFCGVFGMKASYGRVPQAGQSPASTSHTGPISRTVADSALLLRIIAGPHGSDPVTLEGEPADYLDGLERGIAGKRIAYSPDLGFITRIDREVAATCYRGARALDEAGAHVEDVSVDWGDPMAFMLDLWPAIWAGRIGDQLAKHRDEFDPGVVACAEEGMRQAPNTFVRAQMRRVEYCERTYRLFEDYDFLVTPTVGVPAFEVGRLQPPGYPEHPWDWFSWAAFSFPFNLSWYPAATVPAGFTADGRPIGLQIVGRRFDDLGVLQAARAFEVIRPWEQVRPAL